MGRTEWESPADRAREEAARVKVQTLCSGYTDWLESEGLGFLANTRFTKLNEYQYCLDWSIEDNEAKIVSWGEFRGRKIRKDDYPTLTISVNKIVSGWKFAQATKKPFVLFVGWTDALGFYIPDWNRDYVIEWGGRTVDVRDKYDKEPVFHLPIDEFYILE